MYKAMLFFCIILISFVHSHNWIHSRSRAARASTLQPAPAKPAIRIPHLRVGQNQKFGFEWMSGHPNSEYFFVVTHARHEDKLKQHTEKALKAYLDEAPKSAEITGDEWQKTHASCGFSNMCTNKQARNDGKKYARQLHEGDALYIDRPAVWRNEGISQFQYKSFDLAQDKRVSYTNDKWPWIEAVHHFMVKQARPREWDLGMFSIEGREGPGEYIIHMVWRGYRDVIDVDVLAQDSTDIYGTPSDSSAWVKIDHCQYKEQNYSPNKSRCHIIKQRDASECLDYCMKENGSHQPKCTAVNVVPLHNPEAVVEHDIVNLPAPESSTAALVLEKSKNPHSKGKHPHGKHPHSSKKPQSGGNHAGCESLTAKASDPDAMVCYNVKPKQASTDNPEVDSLWTIIPDDPEDPIFYSTCYNYVQGWNFEGFVAPGVPQPKPIEEKVGDRCLSCSDIDTINGLSLRQVPLWKTIDECAKCNSS